MKNINEPEHATALRSAVNSPKIRTIGLKEAVGFGVGDFYGGGQLVMVATYMSLFWTRFGGMGISAAQGLIGVGTILSAFAALVFGILSDNLYRCRFGRRFGRRRPMLLILSPLILTGVVLWLPHRPFALYGAAFIVWVTLAQLFQTSYNPLPGEMTQDFNGRTRLSTTRLFISTASSTVLPLACSALLSVFGESRPLAYELFGITTTVLFSIAVLIAWHSTWELTPSQAGFGSNEDRRSKRRHAGPVVWIRRLVSVFRQYASTLRIDVFRKHLAIYLLVQISMDVFGQTFVFYVIYDWNRTAAFASLLLGCSAISLPLMPLFGWLFTQIGPKRLYALNFMGCLSGLVLLFGAWMAADRMPRGWWTVFAVVGAVVFFSFKSLCGFLPWAVFPFIADVDEMVTTRYRSATFSGVQAFFRQLGSGIAVMCVGAILGATGFDATRATQPVSATIGVGSVLLGWFAVSMIICWVISAHLTLDRRTDRQILAEIARLRSGGSKADVDPDTKRTVERLTGVPYEKCWNTGGVPAGASGRGSALDWKA
ncbi:MAG: MFS transporter [Bifidobacterium sp.]|jgi:oligogalacturonide transporter